MEERIVGTNQIKEYLLGKNLFHFVIPIMAFGYAIVYLRDVSHSRFETALYGCFLSTFVILFSLIILFKNRELRNPDNPSNMGEISNWKTPALFFGLCIYVGFMNLLGYLISSTIFFGGMMYLFGTRRWIILLSVTFGLSIISYIIFAVFFNILLPTGYVWH